MAIVPAESVSEFFVEVVSDAMKARGVEATDGTTHYIVGVLSDYARPDPRAGEALARPLAFLLDEALHVVAPAERFERLRTLGDAVLYSSGFFHEHFESRGVDQKYLFGIGATAYDGAASMIRAGQGEPDIFGELACNFEQFVEVLVDVADTSLARSAGSSRSLLHVYERWLRTGSERLASTLTTQGLVPSRGVKGLH